MFDGRSAVRKSFVRNRAILFFIPGIVLLVAGIVVIVSSSSDTCLNTTLPETFLNTVSVLMLKRALINQPRLLFF